MHFLQGPKNQRAQQQCVRTMFGHFLKLSGPVLAEFCIPKPFVHPSPSYVGLENGAKHFKFHVYSMVNA